MQPVLDYPPCTDGHSDVVSSRYESGEKMFDLRDMHGLFNGGVSAADLKEATLQCVLTDHHRKKNSHLIIPAERGQKQTHMKYVHSNIND